MTLTVASFAPFTSPGTAFAADDLKVEVSQNAVNMGQQATLNADLEGTAATLVDGYQWYADGKPLAGETSQKLVIDKLTRTEALKKYSVEVNVKGQGKQKSAEAAPNAQLYFPDANMAKCIFENAKFPKSFAEAEKFRPDGWTGVNCKDMDIKSIEGIQYMNAPKLGGFMFAGNHITDISPLKGMNLQSKLNLDEQVLDDIVVKDYAAVPLPKLISSDDSDVPFTTKANAHVSETYTPVNNDGDTLTWYLFVENAEEDTIIEFGGTLKVVSQIPAGLPKFSLSKAQAGLDETVEVQLDGFKPNTTVQLKMDGKPWTTITVDDLGKKTENVTVPGDITVGKHTVTTEGQLKDTTQKLPARNLEVTNPYVTDDVMPDKNLQACFRKHLKLGKNDKMRIDAVANMTAGGEKFDKLDCSNMGIKNLKGLELYKATVKDHGSNAALAVDYNFSGNDIETLEGLPHLNPDSSHGILDLSDNNITDLGDTSKLAKQNRFKTIKLEGNHIWDFNKVEYVFHGDGSGQDILAGHQTVVVDQPYRVGGTYAFPVTDGRYPMTLTGKTSDSTYSIDNSHRELTFHGPGCYPLTFRNVPKPNTGDIEYLTAGNIDLVAQALPSFTAAPASSLSVTDKLSATVKDFDSGEKVTVKLVPASGDPIELGSVNASAADPEADPCDTPSALGGSAEFTNLTIPLDTPAGKYKLVASGQDSELSVQADLTVTRPALTLTVEPSPAKAGQTIKVGAANLFPRERATFTLAANGEDASVTVDTDVNADGTATANLAVPADAKPGQYTVAVKGETSRLEAHQDVLMLSASAPQLTASAQTVRAGDKTTLTVDHMLPAENVLFSLVKDDKSEPIELGKVAAGQDGTTKFEATMPADLAAGQYRAIAAGETSELQSDTEIIVLSATPASLKVDPTSAAPGEQVKLTGANFLPGENVDVNLLGADGSLVKAVSSATAGPDGSVSPTVTLPADLTPGTYTIQASGKRSEQIAETAFEVVKAQDEAGDQPGDESGNEPGTQPEPSTQPSTGTLPSAKPSTGTQPSTSAQPGTETKPSAEAKPSTQPSTPKKLPNTGASNSSMPLAGVLAGMALFAAVGAAAGRARHNRRSSR
ncbi:LPXTG cell wall anchor domain-containing protein [Cutibacterium equinum]|uniref:LPXTG cell wall anchor domain-containing protein n=1 Tax=Cutibacterium equinum TaxID=3016342 RepID=A0ABY7QXS4_9ACTN|nr:LPXTG cell wall anchor domain-containing protein [Cutibacterium equinum]WCC79854.1 LPXTG cell wall anchor domain-containing protein [Cutibacterium equinum]